ncbi:hypothetical protein Tco_0285499 [Tanacetum coccineum]
MYIMTSSPRIRDSVQGLHLGVTDCCLTCRAAAVASPVGVLELDTHSSSEADPSESSPPPISVAPMVSPFLCSDDSEVLTVRKSVRPLPSHRLALRYTSHHLDRFTSGSSSSYSSSDHSSSRHSISGYSLSGHASLDTTVADLSTPPRFVYPPLARTSQCSEAYLCWRSAPIIYHVSTDDI